MEYVIYNCAYFDALLEMALDLWTDFPQNKLEKALREIENSETKEVFLAKDKDAFAGFVYVSIRNDYVEGADSSPTGYLEGIYVKPNYRNRGLTRELFALGEKWVIQKGCHQIGSDTWDWNASSIAFHQCIGFDKEDTLVHFIKNIPHDK